MSDNAEEFDVNNATDINEIKDAFRELLQRNAHLKTLIADDRQRLQQIEFKHRESVDTIAILKSQKEAIAKQLEDTRERNNTINNNNNQNGGYKYDRDSLEDTENSDDDNDDNDNDIKEDLPKNKKDSEIKQLKEEIEELQLALAEERMLGMQLDFSNRQSAQRADALQYQLAEEKLKNMELESTTQQLQLNQYSNSSHAGFVHVRDTSNIDNDNVFNSQFNDDDNDLNNNNNNNNRQQQQQQQMINANNNNNNNSRNQNNSKNDNDDDDSTSDLSKEFDLKIEEDEDNDVVDAKEEAHQLRHKLLEEQFEKEELKHRHRKSELQLMQYKEALIELRNKYNIDEKKLDPAKRAFLDPDYALNIDNQSRNSNDLSSGNGVDENNNNNNNNNDNSNENENINNTNDNQNNNDNNNNNNNIDNGLSEEEKREYEMKIDRLQQELDLAKKKSQTLDKERRDSLNIMSKNFFAKQLQAARDTHSLEENMQEEINELKDQVYDLTKSKIKLLQSTHDTIEQLRSHIVELSYRLRKHENWGLEVTGVTPGNDAMESVNVTDL